MRGHINTTATKIWKMMGNKLRRDAYVSAHISNTVASQILMLREAKGWTQKQLAEKCGMRQSRISALEDPNYENFEAATLRRLASAFDVALTIRFIPFSELTGWAATLSSQKLTPKDFAHDSPSPETSAAASSAVGAAPVQISNTKTFVVGLPVPSTRSRVAQTDNVLRFPTVETETSRRKAA